MSGFEIHREPEDIFRLYAPVAPAMTYDIGDPVQIVTDQLADCADATATPILVSTCVGFACEPAEGIHAGSRVTEAADGFGVVEGQQRSYWPFDAPGLLLRTRNFYDDGAATLAEKDYTEFGGLYTIKGITGTNVWGVEEAAPAYVTGAGTVVAADDIAVIIVAILDNNMIPLATDATQTAGDGWLVFRPTGYSQMQFGGV